MKKTFKEKLQLKRRQNKKGFTLVELVIVIAILAILAAIAIPVIRSTVRSAKLSAMESDCSTINMLVKEAINTSKVELKATKWNGRNIYQATINDVCQENQVPLGPDVFRRNISGDVYEMVWTDEKNIKVAGPGYDVTGTLITGDERISSLDPE